MNAFEKARQSADFLRLKFPIQPVVGVVLGSGLGAFADQPKPLATIAFDEIPHFCPPTVAGHGGRLILVDIQGQPILIQQGRVHFYEGHSMEAVAHPVRTMGLLGVRSVLLTNAAGGLQADMIPGELMVLRDHINLMGSNPLIGPNLDQFGPRFPDMTTAYSTDLRAHIKSVFQRVGLSYREGVYIGLSGPTYETPAEVEHLRRIGGDAVGMSTVPETIALRHMGIKVAAISCITNKAAGLSEHPLSHEEVTETGKKVEKVFSDVLLRLLPIL